MDIESKRQRLLDIFTELGGCAVAFSGGVDSAVVAKAAQLALGDKALAATAVSPSLATGELELARSVAAEIGIRHIELRTNEIADPDYVKNGADRCFYCKTELYGVMRSQVDAWGIDVIVNGANVDDQSDYRPGMQAASNSDVRSPLIEADCSKADVRALARHWGLAVAEKPAMPCLSSRIAYGESVTPERLRQIDSAERWLRDHGFQDVRVRFHPGSLARVELLSSQIPLLLNDETLYASLVAEFKKLDFRFVTLDLEGRRSGSLNELVQIEMLTDDGAPSG